MAVRGERASEGGGIELHTTAANTAGFLLMRRRLLESGNLLWREARSTRFAVSILRPLECQSGKEAMLIQEASREGAMALGRSGSGRFLRESPFHLLRWEGCGIAGSCEGIGNWGGGGSG